MSRRKQGKPQQRKTLDSIEDNDPDLLVCGCCQTKFSLSDIMRFIRHKVHHCYKDELSENVVNSGSYDDDGDDVDGADSQSLISYERPSISAKIHVSRKSTTDCCISPKLSPTQTNPVCFSPDSRTFAPYSPEQEKELDLSGTCRLKPVFDNDELEDDKTKLPCKAEVVDQAVNTANSEPVNLTCSTCKAQFTSAWSIIEHVQSVHAIDIYTTPIKKYHSPSINETKKSPTPPLTPKKEEMSPPTTSLKTPILTTSQHSPVSPMNQGFPPMFRIPGLPNGMPGFTDRPPLSPMNLFRPPISAPDFRYNLSLPESYHRFNMAHGIVPFDTPPPGVFPPFDRPRLPGIPLTHEDFYSHRLRQLAGTTPPSPATAIIHRRETRDTISPTSPSTGNPASPSNDHRPDSPCSQSNKACEFCGKTFRFQSNLIVHRRKHTGEKPFKCHMCPHACTQASKLKRHMKTHFTKSELSQSSNQSDNSRESDHSSPDSTNRCDDDVNDDSDEIDEDELEDEDDYDNDRTKDESVTENCSDGKQSDHSPGGEPSESSQRFNAEDKPVPDFSFSLARKRESVLREMMANSGLDSIPHYQKAMHLAISENSNSKSSMNGYRSPRSDNSGQYSPENLVMNRRLSDSQIVTSVLKENQAGDGGPLALMKSPLRHHSDHEDEPMAKFPRRHHRTEPLSNLEAMYAMWYHPSMPSRRDFPMLPHHIQHGAMSMNRHHHHHGFHPKMPHDGALSKSLISPMSGVSPHQPLNGLPMMFNRNKDRRNDQCEFCGKIFKNCSNLTVHRRSHTGEKPYRCELCSYACAQSSKLTRHMRTHGRLGKDVYYCKFCHMPFSVASTLEKHMRKCGENHPGMVKPEDMNGMKDLSPQYGMKDQDLSPQYSLHSERNSPPSFGIIPEINHAMEDRNGIKHAANLSPEFGKFNMKSESNLSLQFNMKSEQSLSPQLGIKLDQNLGPQFGVMPENNI